MVSSAGKVAGAAFATKIVTAIGVNTVIAGGVTLGTTIALPVALPMV